MARTIRHRSHSCMLAETTLQVPYVCDGCYEKGIGETFTCHSCNFHLHSCCASNTESSQPFMHSLHNKQGHLLRFHFGSNRPGTNFFPPCNACGKAVQGFAYRCVLQSCGYVLHPCCAHFPPSIKLPLVDSFSRTEKETALSLCENLRGACGFCGGSAYGWAYVVPSWGYSLHVGCIREKLLEMAICGQHPPGRSLLPVAQHLPLQCEYDPPPLSSAQHLPLQWEYYPPPLSPAQQLPLQRVQRRSRSGTRLFFKLTGVLTHGILAALMGNPAPLIAGFITSFLN